MTRILTSSIWNKILKIWYTLFELILIEVKRSKTYFNIYLPQEVGAFGINIDKEPQKPRQNNDSIFLTLKAAR